ncbi:MAG: hypothetical protein JXB42_11210 [Deltaproteobacteria bacterium]|nr:hypothetical protein [Deltaproteobacteria bacterium]
MNIEEKLNDVQSALYQIHGLTDLLEAAGEQFAGPVFNKLSDPLASLAQVIREKTQHCLDLLEDVEKQGVTL